MPKFPRLKVGKDVVIRWLDSGAGEKGLPVKGVCRLVFGETHGKVLLIEKDKRIHRALCKQRKKCHCTYVVLVMCSSGEDDVGSEQGAIWYDSIVEVR